MIADCTWCEEMENTVLPDTSQYDKIMCYAMNECVERPAQLINEGCNKFTMKSATQYTSAVRSACFVACENCKQHQ